MPDREKSVPDPSVNKPEAPGKHQPAPQDEPGPKLPIIRDVTGNTGRCFIIIGARMPVDWEGGDP